MNEVTKLYENAGVEPIYPYTKCYPEFTTEKQLELIKLFSSNSIGFGTCIGEFCRKENFEEALAESINHLWQDLTEEEKQQVKEILE